MRDVRPAQLLWLIGGTALGFGVASLPSIGLFVLPVGVAVLVAAGIVTRGSGWPLTLTGAALPLLWVAWRHREGPGWVTYETQDGVSGGGEVLDPLPWLLTGLGLIAASALLVVVDRRRVSGPGRPAGN